MNVKETLVLCESILTDLGDLPERAEEFVDGTQVVVLGIKENIERKQIVTDGQARALDNIRSAVDKWMR